MLIEKVISECLSTRGQVTTVAISVDGGYIAASDVRLLSFIFIWDANKEPDHSG